MAVAGDKHRHRLSNSSIVGRTLLSIRQPPPPKKKPSCGSSFIKSSIRNIPRFQHARCTTMVHHAMQPRPRPALMLFHGFDGVLVRRRLCSTEVNFETSEDQHLPPNFQKWARSHDTGDFQRLAASTKRAPGALLTLVLHSGRASQVVSPGARAQSCICWTSGARAAALQLSAGQPVPGSPFLEICSKFTLRILTWSSRRRSTYY